MGEFEVDAGNSGIFDVKYTISGGTVENIEVESENLALLVKINSSTGWKNHSRITKRIHRC